MNTTATCACGTGEAGAHQAAEPCTCGCCGPKTAENEINELIAMRDAIDRRLAELQEA